MDLVVMLCTPIPFSFIISMSTSWFTGGGRGGRPYDGPPAGDYRGGGGRAGPPGGSAFLFPCRLVSDTGMVDCPSSHQVLPTRTDRWEVEDAVPPTAPTTAATEGRVRRLRMIVVEGEALDMTAGSILIYLLYVHTWICSCARSSILQRLCWWRWGWRRGRVLSRSRAASWSLLIMDMHRTRRIDLKRRMRFIGDGCNWWHRKFVLLNIGKATIGAERQLLVDLYA